MYYSLSAEFQATACKIAVVTKIVENHAKIKVIRLGRQAFVGGVCTFPEREAEIDRLARLSSRYVSAAAPNPLRRQETLIIPFLASFCRQH
jgi:hypothetical protein